MMRKEERNHLTADLATVEQLLASAPQEDVLGTLGLRARRDRLRSELSAAGAPSAHAKTSLVFFGEPVTGRQGIDAEFAAKALSTFEDLVKKTWGEKQHGGLGAWGPVPDGHRAALHVTGVVRGSFGFELEELGEPSELDASLEETVAAVTQAIIAATESDTALLEVSDVLGERSFGALRAFFSTLKKHNSGLKISTGETTRRLELGQIVAAAERTEATKTTEQTLDRGGEFLAVLPDSRRFEFRPSDTDKLLKGRVADNLSTQALQDMNAKWANKQCVGTFNVVTVSGPGGSRDRYTLLALGPPIVAPAT